jgi:peptidoglycan/LPS O-acetylase OafA/YrhL
MHPLPPPASAAPAFGSFGYVPALDGLRALAVLIVLAAHFGLYRWVPGGFGVTLFFFISGMLITRLLLAEKAATGRIAVGRFYLRRMLRLYPALLVAVAVGTLATVAAGGDLLWGKVFAALFYGINFYGIVAGWSQGYTGFDPLAVLWSLAIEEQYYIVFPLLALALAGRLRTFTGWVTVAVVAVLGWRVLLVLGGASSGRIYMGTDTRIDSILYGCLLTLLLARSTEAGATTLRWLSKPWLQWLALACLLATFVLRNPFFRDSLRYTMQGLALMPLVASLCFTRSLPRITAWLERETPRAIGRLSYSLYLMHGVAITLAELVFSTAGKGPGSSSVPARIGFVVMVVPLTLALAAACYRWVETPFGSLRRRFGSHVPVRGAPA